MDALTIGPVVLSTAVLLALAGVLVSNGVAEWFRRRGVDPGPLLWKMTLSGFVAARAVFVLRHHDLFLARPWSALDFRDGGFAPMAGLLVACLVGAGLAGRQAALRRPLMAASAAGVAVWLGGTVLLQALAPPGAPLPDMSVRRLDGTEVSLRSYQGKPLVVNLWATWCPPCRREMPALGAMQAARPDVAFVFVNQGESAAVVARYLAAQGLRMQNVVTDPARQLAARTGVVGFPTTLFYDAGGVLRGRHVGELSEAAVRERLTELGR
ncbi:TlpA disulfide reductase family protein [Massilia yuzhufengensis]|uniref:Thiol-disulfide isomerase or thioredoxin n=1 Tax=Massilia yuzhufengensis TaxID=1164594 RepID=A0A1I1QTB7_9BURK|nr:TlpA disulfide reductase family protein [Massilia yuzhufengensis]SFD25374.1 Thiol-disulfide isomerase or thioredoxin [Massilia yuzhufengensis]